MDIEALLAKIEDLGEDIEDLKSQLQPLLSGALSETTKKLPVLDRAKLFVIIVYAIESLIFSYLRLNGVDARDHAVFRELARVKQYFEKIKMVEEGPGKPSENLSLNREAAQRIIKHALAGNDAYDAAQREKQLKQRLVAARTLMPPEEILVDTERMTAQEDEAVLPASSDDNDETNPPAPSIDVPQNNETLPDGTDQIKGAKRRLEPHTDENGLTEEDGLTQAPKPEEPTRKKRKRNKKRRKSEPETVGEALPTA